MLILREKENKVKLHYGWGDMIKRLLLFAIMLLLPLSVVAEHYIGVVVTGNGKEFKRLSAEIVKEGKRFPLYLTKEKDGKLTWAYNFGQIAVELKNIDYDANIAARLGIDKYTTYPDLGITLYEMNDPYQVDDVYLQLNKEHMVRYAEISLIEDGIWEK
jgi:hypothetical protein